MRATNAAHPTHNSFQKTPTFLFLEIVEIGWIAFSDDHAGDSVAGLDGFVAPPMDELP